MDQALRTLPPRTAAKRAVVMALIHAVREQGVAQTTVRLLFFVEMVPAAVDSTA